jgi:hypothetical protein
MIPRCFPTTYATTNGTTRMVVDVIADTTGLVRWVDYIPVQQTAASPHIPNSYDADGAMELDVLGDTTGLQSWLDYIPVYEDNAATIAWSTDAGGYIPVNIPS